MPCYKPLRGYKARFINPSGKRSIVFNQQEGYKDLPIDLPCGQCIGCRLERSRQWAVRCVHEASLYEKNCFITLTYKPDCLPPDGSLVVSDYQKFMKRLRKKYSDRTIRFFQCGEYGERTKRPHYHACLFNFDFAEKQLWKTVNGQKYFISQELSELWPYGHSTIGDVTFESAAYVARYITKKVTGQGAEAHYEVIDEITGEIRQRKPEYTTMSRKPGIGKGWFEKYKSDVYPSDFVILRGKKFRAPRFYDHLLEVLDPTEFAVVKARRKPEEEEPINFRRLRTRERVKMASFNRLKRSYENG